MDKDDLNHLAGFFQEIEFHDSAVVQQGEEANCFFIISEGLATAYINQQSDASDIEMKLTCGDVINGKNLYMNTPQSATIIAQNTLKCIMMEKNEFKMQVEPIIRQLEDKAAKYNAFINQLI